MATTPSATQDDKAGRVVVSEALKNHLDKLFTRAKAERADREAKWAENRLVSEGEVYSAGAAAEAESPGQWRVGDKANQTERLRIARQKVVAAKSALGDALYKNNLIPFMLVWAAGIQDINEKLDAIRERVTEILLGGNAADRMRTEIEDSACMGEGWIHGTVATDASGRVVGGVECVSPWEMFYDAAGDDDLAQAEYVIRDRMLSVFEAAKIARGAPTIYSAERVKLAMASASTGKASASGAPASQRRQSTSLMPWTEMWCSVPSSLVDGDTPADGTPDETTLDWTPIMAVKAGDEYVALKVKPGTLPYYRMIWDIDRMRTLPQGVYDIMGPTQECMTGAVRAWLSNLRRQSEITLAGKRNAIMQDVETIGTGIKFIDVDPDVRDVRDAIQQFKVDGDSQSLVGAIEMLMEFADLESNIPRLQSGQAPLADSTAYEIRSRLAASGKYLNEIVRRHDGGIRWLVGWVLYVMFLEGEIDNEKLVTIQPRGFTQFADLIQRLEGLLRLLSLGSQNPRVDSLLDHATLTRQIAQADDLDVSKVLLSSEAMKARAESEAASEERQLALATAQADLAGKKAKADRDAASAESLRARPQLDRARFIKDVEDSAKKTSAKKPASALPTQPLPEGAAQ